MKYLLYAGILGFSFWICSEVIEIYLGGYNSAVYYLTTLYHAFAGFGVWGLHKTQSDEKTNYLSLVGAAIVFIAYIGIAYFPIQVMNSGLTFAEFLDVIPAYKIPGALWFFGMIAFGISILKTRHFPAWTGVVFLLGTIMFTATPLLKWPVIVVNFTNIIFAATVIYLCIISLREHK